METWYSQDDFNDGDMSAAAAEADQEMAAAAQTCSLDITNAISEAQILANQPSQDEVDIMAAAAETDAEIEALSKTSAAEIRVTEIRSSEERKPMRQFANAMIEEKLRLEAERRLAKERVAKEKAQRKAEQKAQKEAAAKTKSAANISESPVVDLEIKARLTEKYGAVRYLTGSRHLVRGIQLYEAVFVGKPIESTEYISREELELMGVGGLVKRLEART